MLSFKTQKNITNNKKVNIKKITIPKVTIPKTTTDKKIDELSKVASSLKSIVEEEDKQAIKQNNPTEDEIQNILSNLKRLKPIEEKKTVIVRKSKVPTKKRINKKRKITKKRETTKIIKPKKIIIYKEIKEEDTITAEEYRKRLAKESKIDEDIASLSMVDTVDMNIEEKIKKGEIKELTTPKPIVEQKTIYIPLNQQKIDEDIPWAKLREVDEKVDGIFIKESIN
jgi:hypothetical protein